MAPISNEPIHESFDIVTSGERVVISGMSGLFPDSHHIKDLENILYNKINPISPTPRWKYNHPEVVQYQGRLPDLEMFDAQFFKVHYKLGINMDPMSRKLLEQTYQAIYDAGVNPMHLSGRKVGVYVGIGFTESEKNICFNSKTNGFSIVGCNKSMFANRISYWLNIKGPSMSIDDSCCSSIAALELAYLALSRGECEAAIVGGTNICLYPQSTVHYRRMMCMSLDGKTKSFDEDASGFVKSEAINVLFLQKAKDALRIYASVINVKSQFTGLLEGSTGPRFGFCRNPDDMAFFLKNFYRDAGVPPQAVEYVEAFGSGVPEAEKSELEWLEDVFCKNRDNELLVGSVISNIGYSEAASGISAVIKVLLGYHNGLLAANLNCDNPRSDVTALRDGRMRILTEHQQFGRTYAAVNGSSITGVNTHILLHGHYTPKDNSRYKCNIPYLVTISARQESSVQYILDYLKSQPIDPEELALLHAIHESSITGHLGRGFTIIDTNEEQNTVSLCAKATHFDDAQRPLWFVYSGMGSQWVGMGTQLMRIPIFSAAINRCNKVLEPKGIDVVSIITSPEKTTFDNILNSFVGIAAIQIGLTDILRELGLVPDNIIGHSVGELGCAYADGCITAEEMILAAYYRGLVSVQTDFIRGSMAAVGIGYQQVLKMCPPEIEVACHNGPDSSTISGPANIMREFVAELKSRQIFAKEVPCSNIAYHSRYIAEAGPELLKHLKEVIKSPKPRSECWLSTSVPKDMWNDPKAKSSSAEYHTNNLLNPVLFEETLRLVPANAVLIEIAPHGLLQAILKRSLPQSCRIVPLTNRGHNDNVHFLLEAIGKLYLEGYSPKVKVLYPKIEFPVSTGTPMLSHLIKWVHCEKWIATSYISTFRKTGTTCKFLYSIHDEENKYLVGNVLRGENKLPFAAALVAVWDTLAMTLGVPKKQLSVQFEDLKFYVQPFLHDRHPLRLFVSLHRGTGLFEIMDGNTKVATGYITGEVVDARPFLEEFYSSEELVLKHEDIYKLLHKRGYNCRGEFRVIYSANKYLTEAQLYWRNNWVTLIDGMLQLNDLRHQHNSLSVPTHIRRIVIDVEKHLQSLIPIENDNLVTAHVFEAYNLIRCGGVAIEDITSQYLLTMKRDSNLMALKFNQLFQEAESDGRCGGTFFEPLQQNRFANSDISLQCSQTGDFNSLKWVEVPHINGSGVKVSVHYAGINNIDVKTCSGEIPQVSEQNGFGMDLSGVTESGERVMGLVSGGAISSCVLAQHELLWPIPRHWSLEEAATVPLAYCLALYILRLKYKLNPGMTLFVHGGSGALGQAVISVALGNGCKVFTTVSDLKKKRFLCKLFPDLKEEQIGNSRDHTFCDMVNLGTNGKGCDFVLSCVSEDLKDRPSKFVASIGKLIDLTQVITRDNFYFGMFSLSNERSYSIIDFRKVIKEEFIRKKLQILLAEGINCGYVRPLTRVVYASVEASRAFKLVTASLHRGRALLQLREKTNRPLSTMVELRFHCNANLTHLIFCNNEYLGLHLAERLTKRGARKIVLHGLEQSAYVDFEIRCLQNVGVDVSYCNELLESENDISSLINNNNTLGHLEGVYFITTDKQNLFEKVPQMLDVITRKSCPHLRYFGIVGNDVDNGLNLCFSRSQDKLPVTWLILPHAGKITEDLLSEVDIINLFEIALMSNESFLVAFDHTKKYQMPFDGTVRTTGLKVSDELLQTDISSHLNIRSNKSRFSFLRGEHNMSLTEPNLQIRNPNEVQTNMFNWKKESTQGLSTFYSYVDPDELLVTTEMMFLPTLGNSSERYDDVFDGTQTYLCLIPGLEGHHRRFYTLCERLKLPAIVLQPGLDQPDESVSDLAKRYTEALLNKTTLKENFYLLGYESGALVALEMAAILEKQGMMGTIFCIGESPDKFHVMLKNELKEYSCEGALQNALAKHMVYLMVGENTYGIDKELSTAETWLEKMEICMSSISGKVAYSMQYAQEIINCAYRRIKQVQSYRPTPQALRSKLILINAAESVGSFGHFLKDYSQQPVTVYQLETPLANSAADLRCTSIINSHLDTKLLEEFDKKNLCDTYLISSKDILKMDTKN